MEKNLAYQFRSVKPFLSPLVVLPNDHCQETAIDYVLSTWQLKMFLRIKEKEHRHIYFDKYLPINLVIS